MSQYWIASFWGGDTQYRPNSKSGLYSDASVPKGHIKNFASPAWFGRKCSTRVGRHDGRLCWYSRWVFSQSWSQSVKVLKLTGSPALWAMNLELIRSSSIAGPSTRTHQLSAFSSISASIPWEAQISNAKLEDWYYSFLSFFSASNSRCRSDSSFSIHKRKASFLDRRTI